MNRKMVMVTAGLLAICGALALSGVAGAKKPAGTKVTIQLEVGGYFGFVKSSKTQKCANGRVVALYRQKGGSQDLSKDKKVGTDIAQANGDGYMWSINNDQSGKFYAHVKAKKGCRGASSKSVPFL